MTVRAKKVNGSSTTCPLCGGRKSKGTATFSADPGNGAVAERQVPATICSQCGEVWIADNTARMLERIVDAARSAGMTNDDSIGRMQE